MKPSKYCIERLQSAIQTMRNAYDRAERELSRVNAVEKDVIAFVGHQFVWGLANAHIDIESALTDCV